MPARSVSRGAAGAPAAAAAADARGSPALARAVAGLAPRYAFGGAGGPFYLRPPFAAAGAPPVRFVGLAPVSAGAVSADPAAKWLYALRLVPAAMVRWVLLPQPRAAAARAARLARARETRKLTRGRGGVLTPADVARGARGAPRGHDALAIRARGGIRRGGGCGGGATASQARPSG